MILFLIITIIICLLMAGYVGFRTINLFELNWQGYRGYFNTVAKKIFWLLLVFASLSFFFSRIFTVSDYWVPLISNIIFGVMLCFFYAIIAIDIIRFVSHFIFRTSLNRVFLQVLYVVLAFTLFIIGLYSASSPRIVHYQVNIDKLSHIEHLRVVQLSDIHINQTTSTKFIDKMVAQVNELKPDYIFITGDTLDSSLEPFLDKQLAQNFSKLKSKYGTYTVFGNHEYYGILRDIGANEQEVIAAFEDGGRNNEYYELLQNIGDSEQKVIRAFEDAGMKVLKDSVMYDSKTGIYIIGRDDYSLQRYGHERAKLSLLMTLIDEDNPVLLLDHQPQDLAETQQEGIDVMFSGHTHAGQIFPANLLVKFLYTNYWGIYKNNQGHQFTSVVSSGYGLWGPPIRLMTQSEIVVADLYFHQ